MLFFHFGHAACNSMLHLRHRRFVRTAGSVTKRLAFCSINLREPSIEGATPRSCCRSHNTYETIVAKAARSSRRVDQAPSCRDWANRSRRRQRRSAEHVDIGRRRRELPGHSCQLHRIGTRDARTYANRFLLSGCGFRPAARFVCS